LGGDTSLFRLAGLSLGALVLGFCLGTAARASILPARLGIAAERVTGIEGLLADDPRNAAGGWGMGYLELRAAAGEGGLRVSATGRVLVYYDEEVIPRISSFGRGSRVYLEGSLLGAGSGGLPRFRARSVHVLVPAPAIEGFRTEIRLRLTEFFRLRDWGGLALALLVGSRDLLDSDLAAAYRRAGCSHVLALSGMHLAVIASIIAFLLKKPLGLFPAAVLGVLLISAYVYLAGGQPSLVRAMVMYLLGTVAVLGGFKSSGLPLLSLAFLIQLSLSPGDAGSGSFILSYLALAGILVLSGPVHEMLRAWLPGALSQGFAASLGAFLATAAVSAATFGELYPVGLLASLIITPLSTVFMILAMACPLVMVLVPALAGLLDRGLSHYYGLLNKTAALAGLAPGIPAGVLPVLIVSTLGILAILLAGKRRKGYYDRLEPFDGA
jgi:competence protein ComEC